MPSDALRYLCRYVNAEMSEARVSVLDSPVRPVVTTIVP